MSTHATTVERRRARRLRSLIASRHVVRPLALVLALLLLAPSGRSSAQERSATSDIPVPSSPGEVVDDEVGGEAVVWVDWGAAGPSHARDSQLIDADQEALRRFLHSPELRADAIRLAGSCAARTQEALRAHLAAWQEDYATREQATALPCGSHVAHAVLPLPPWAWGLPLTARAATQVLLFDDRDPRQRQWVLDQAHTPGRLSYAYCTAWRSGDDRDRFWKEHPLLGIHPVASDQFAVFYGVTAYPAQVRFETESMTLEEGLDP